jgi:hypothetical protein
MKRFFSIPALALTALGGLAAVGVVGCVCNGCGVGGHPPVDVPAPNGYYVNKFQEIQAAKAEPTDFVFFPDEWFQGGTQLGPYGQYHLTQVIRRLPSVPFPVVIQPVTEVAKNDTRRQVIVDALKLAGVEDADPRVIVAYSDAEHLRAEETELTYYQMIYNRLLRNGAYNRGYGGFGFGGYGGFGYGAGFFGRSLLGGFGGLGAFGGYGLGGFGF